MYGLRGCECVKVRVRGRKREGERGGIGSRDCWRPGAEFNSLGAYIQFQHPCPGMVEWAGNIKRGLI